MVCNTASSNRGAGKTPQRPDDQVTVRYKGWLINGKVFDQTQDGQSATFPAGNLIPGWVEALSLMKAKKDEWESGDPVDLRYVGRKALAAALSPAAKRWCST